MCSLDVHNHLFDDLSTGYTLSVILGNLKNYTLEGEPVNVIDCEGQPVY